MRILYYAGAADAAGGPGAELATDSLTAAQLIELLGRSNAHLAEVLSRCTLLVGGSPVHDPAELISAEARVDVLPPFAGG